MKKCRLIEYDSNHGIHEISPVYNNENEALKVMLEKQKNHSKSYFRIEEEETYKLVEYDPVFSKEYHTTIKGEFSSLDLATKYMMREQEKHPNFYYRIEK